MKYLLFIISLSLITSCNEDFRKEVFPTVQEQANQLTYVKDNRTGLCFVYNTIFTDVNSKVLTNVPCTPEVERLIK